MGEVERLGDATLQLRGTDQPEDVTLQLEGADQLKGADELESVNWWLEANWLECMDLQEGGDCETDILHSMISFLNG